ncbi:gliding motility-associated protein GldE [Arachidicoccus soli]|uniref:Gliding motility-associated protein GldE n=1 Tax=Arachidicoccus soli TaxID=2341117 RepID=A0A386HRC9_9BACT|nr:gliding motility-associated protein GldE [Arachidicoccus soli]AYD48507.1 gliding motility-associated protein GldE [Arachidicoccus soli]
MFILHTILNNTLVQAVHVDAADSQMATILGVLLLVLFIFSFAISGSQVAFFSFGIKDINLIKTKPQASYKRILDLLEHPQELLYALQIASCFFYLAIIFTFSYLVDHLVITDISFWGLLIIKAIVVFILIFLFGECLPRAYAAQENIRFAKDFGVLTEIVYYFFRRIAASMLFSSNKLEAALFKRDTSAYYNVELNNAISLTHRNASEEEKRILQGVLKFNKITVKQVMKSRLDVCGIDYDMRFDQVVKRICEVKFTRLPVYEKSMDKVVGLLNIKDLLPFIDEKENFDWHKYISTIYFVYEQKMAGELLEEFQEKHLRFAVVVDEFGGTSGIVTMQDIQEEIIGEIKDERDETDLPYKKIDDYNYIFDGKLMINDVCRAMSIPSDTFDVVKGDSDSLAGLVLELAGEIPPLNEAIYCGDFKFSVEEISKNRLQKIRVMIDMED